MHGAEPAAMWRGWLISSDRVFRDSGIWWWRMAAPLVSRHWTWFSAALCALHTITIALRSTLGSGSWLEQELEHKCFHYNMFTHDGLVSELSTRRCRAGDILFLASAGGSVAPNVIIMSRYCGFILQPEVTRPAALRYLAAGSNQQLPTATVHPLLLQWTFMWHYRYCEHNTLWWTWL